MQAAQFDTQKSVAAARTFLAKQKKLLIGGEWTFSASGEAFDSIDPSTEEILAAVPAGAAADVDKAAAAARYALEAGDWPQMSLGDRGRLLLRLADLVEKNAAELSAIETFDNGAPVGFTGYALKLVVDNIRYYAGLTTKLYGESLDLRNDFGAFHVYTRREPAGVVGLITPWNGSLGVLSFKLPAALAAGCTCIVKPAELTSLSALRLGELIEEAGIPPGVVNIVTGLGATAGDALAKHPGVDKLSFTGSTAVGRRLIENSARDFKRLTLELGGKSPLIIMNDADLGEAIPTAANAVFANTGQICIASSRLFVESGVFDKVVEGVAEIAEKLTLGNGFAEGTDLGPLISEKQRERVAGYLHIARSEGADFIAGGNAPSSTGYYLEPTVLANVPQNSRVMREEIFGPVVVAIPFDDLDAALRMANDTEYGLGSGIFTQNLQVAHRAAKRLRAGSVWVNNYGTTDPSVSFGGFKQSGWGRELGRAGLDAYLENKSVVVKL